MTALYYILDIIGTLTEIPVHFIAAYCFQLMPKNKIRSLLPFAAWSATVYALTWFTDAGEYKMLAATLCMTAFYCIFYEITVLNAAVLAVFGSTMLIFSESIGTILSFFTAPSMEVAVEENMMIHWSMYLVVFACRIVVVFVVYLIFRNFSIVFSGIDLLVILFNYGILQIVFIFYYKDFFNQKEGYFNFTLELVCILLTMGFLLPFFYFKNNFILQAAKKEDQMQIERLEAKYAYYEEKLKEEERVRRVYHDLKNHLLILQQQAGNALEVQESVKQLQEQIADYETFYNTGNEFLDIIIKDKARQAQEKKVDLGVNIRFEEGAFIEPLDISTIFGNALDNALEACEKLPADKCLTTVKASRLRDMLVILVENNAQEDAVPDGRTSKADVFRHGFGLSNIRRAAEKYEGECTAGLEGGVFRLKIVIPIPKSA